VSGQQHAVVSDTHRSAARRGQRHAPVSSTPRPHIFCNSKAQNYNNYELLYFLALNFVHLIVFFFFILSENYLRKIKI